jgi:hypothetical protein
MNNAPTQAPEETLTVSDETSVETMAPAEGDAKSSRFRLLASHLNERRLAKAVSAETLAAQKRLVEQRERDEARKQAETASQAAASRRKTQAARQETETAEDAAPIPQWMKWLGAWFDRSFGSSPLVAPLIVSGVFTMDVGMSDPLKMSWIVAFAFTLGLEGSLWYLSRLYEQTRLEGDSTFSLRAGMIGIILLIAGLIGGHAVWEAMGSVPVLVDLPLTESKMPLEDAVPAIAVAVMSAIGTFVWSKRATFRHRVKLRQQNLIDPRAPKFSTWSWILDGPQTFGALRHAVRYRISSPVLAVEDRRLWIMSDRPKVWPVVETVEEETPETSQSQRLKAVPARVVTETERPALSSPERPALPSRETVAETTPGTDIVPTVSQETGDADIVETVGRLKRDEELSLSAIALRLSISKAHAGRHWTAFQKRETSRAGDGETTETETSQTA